MAYIPNMSGMTGESFASADFGDAEETTLTGVVFDIGGNGQATPYSSAITSIIDKQFDEVRQKTSNVLNLPSTWKRRLREFMNKKNNDLLDFLKVTVPSHPVFGPGEILLRRFGNPQVTPSHPSVREFVVDVSGTPAIDEINAELAKKGGDSPLKDYIAQTLAIYDMYRVAGDEALKAQQGLSAKLTKLDRIQGKLSGLFDIEANEFYEPLMQANQDYLKKIFDEAAIETDYTELIKAYRKFVAVRDVVTSARTILLHESEPLCSICLEESVSYTLNPCGHTFCQTCIRKQSGACFICRAHIKDKLKIYFG